MIYKNVLVLNKSEIYFIRLSYDNNWIVQFYVKYNVDIQWNCILLLSKIYKKTITKLHQRTLKKGKRSETNYPYVFIFMFVECKKYRMNGYFDAVYSHLM